MPGLYADDEYDLNGFVVGAVKKDKVIDCKNIVGSDFLIGLPSSGFIRMGSLLLEEYWTKVHFLTDLLPINASVTTTVSEALMALTVMHVQQMLEIISKGGAKGLAHITGGGFADNIPRVFPSGLGAKILTDSWEVLPVFEWIQQVGNIKDAEMI